MKKINNNLLPSAAFAWVLLGIGSAGADEAAPAPQTGEQPPAAEQPAAPTALTTPTLTGPIAGNPNPINFDLGPLGPVYLTTVVSGLGCGRTMLLLATNIRSPV